MNHGGCGCDLARGGDLTPPFRHHPGPASPPPLFNRECLMKTEFIERTWCTQCDHLGEFYNRAPCPKCGWDPIGQGMGIWGGHLTKRIRWVSTVVWWNPKTWFGGYWEDDLEQKIDPRRFAK